MRIKSFEIIGFKSEGRFANLVFSDGPSSVIYGPNGVGKTTVLQIMSAFFSKSESVLMANKVQKLECVLENDKSLSEYKVFAELNGEGGYDWHTDNLASFDELKSLSIGVERGIAPQNISVSSAIIFDFLYRHSRSSRSIFHEPTHWQRRSHVRDSSFRVQMQDLSSELAFFLRRNRKSHLQRDPIDLEVSHLNLNSIKMENIEDILAEQYREARYRTTKNIQSALFDTIASLIENPDLGHSSEKSTLNFVESLRKYQYRIEIALSGSEENAFMSMVKRTLKNYCDTGLEQHENANPKLVNLFKNMIRELEAEDESLDGVNVIVSAFNEQLEFGKKLVIDNSRSAYIDIDGERHGLSELSSGERHILTFLTLMSTAGRGRDFIFIDEPEISLNLKWQREVIGILQGILPDCQIIAASHSPAISQNPSALCRLEVGRLVI